VCVAPPKSRKSLALPRGAYEASPFSKLCESGTAKRSMTFQGFFGSVSHPKHPGEFIALVVSVSPRLPMLFSSGAILLRGGPRASVSCN
jgi:hypothetical protein